MISVIVPALNAAGVLTGALSPLIAPTISGLIKEVIVVDGGSADATVAMAEEAGAVVLRAPKGRGGQLGAGAAAARGDWLLFLHADTALAPGWDAEARRFMEASAGKAAAFAFRLDEDGFGAAWLQAMVALRCALFKLPYGDQGLLVSRRLYDEVGGYRPLPLMEDVDIVRRLGRGRIEILKTAAVTSADRYRKDGYVRRVARNFSCLVQYYAGVAPEKIARRYES